MSWPWSQWKQQYLSLDLLLRSPFNLPGHIKVVSSLIYIRTWSIRVVSRVKLANLPVGGLECLSSRRSPVLVIFHPLSCRASSYLSLFLGFSSWASSVSFAFVDAQPWLAKRKDHRRHAFVRPPTLATTPTCVRPRWRAPLDVWCGACACFARSFGCSLFLSLSPCRGR